MLNTRHIGAPIKTNRGADLRIKLPGPQERVDRSGSSKAISFADSLPQHMDPAAREDEALLRFFGL